MTENGSENGGEDDPEENLTTETDYRASWLSTAWVLFYGFGFPLWLFLRDEIPILTNHVDGTLMAALVLAWGGTVVYVIGPENVEAWSKFQDG